jgi:hypothetical protein
MEINMVAPLFLLAGTAIRAATPMMLKALKKVGAKQLKKPTEAQIKTSKKPLPEKLKKDILEKSRKKESKEIVDRGIRKNKKTDTKENKILNVDRKNKDDGSIGNTRTESARLGRNRAKLKRENPKKYEKLYGEEAYKKRMQDKADAKLSEKQNYPSDPRRAKYGMKAGGFTKRGPLK